MLGIGKYAQGLFYIEYSIYTPVLSLWIKGCHLFRNCLWDATHNESFGLGLTALNEVRKHIHYILDNIYIYISTDHTCVLKLWQGTKIWHDKDIFQEMEIFQDMEGLV